MMRIPRPALVPLGALLLLGGCPADVDIALAAGPQRASDVRFVIRGATRSVYTFKVQEEHPVSGDGIVWEVSVGSAPQRVENVTYGVPPPTFEVRVEARPLLSGHTYCAYAKGWARACFKVESDGSVTATPALDR